MSVLTNIVYVLTDVLETNLLDMEEEFRRRGFALRHEPKRNFNTAIAAIRRLKSDVNRCTPATQENFGNDADIINALLLTVIDRIGDDDMLAFKLFNYIKAMPSRLHLELELDGAFGHLFEKGKEVE